MRTEKCGNVVHMTGYIYKGIQVHLQVDFIRRVIGTKDIRKITLAKMQYPREYLTFGLRSMQYSKSIAWV